MAYQPGQRFISIGGNTAGATSLISSGTALLAGGNNVTLSQNGNAISIHAGAGGANFSAGTTSGNLASVVFSNSNGVNFGLNGSTMTASHNGITSQSNQNLSLYALGNTTQNSSSLMNASNLSFNAMGDLSIGYSNGSINFSAATQTNMVSLNGSTGNLSISGGPNITVGNNASTITISGQPMFDAGVAGSTVGGATFGNNVTSNTGGLAFYAGSNVTLSQATGAGNASITMMAGGGIALAGSNTTFGTGTVNLVAAAGAALTIGSGVQSLNFSVPATSSIVGINGITLSTNGNTISISGPGGVGTAFGTLSNWEPLMFQHGMWSTGAKYGQSSLYIHKLQPQAYVSATQLQQVLSISGSTSTSGGYTLSLSLMAGIYTVNASTLSLITQSSGSVTQSIGFSSAVPLASYTGIRAITMPMNINMSPGNYYIGMWSRSSASLNGAINTIGTANMYHSVTNLPFQGMINQGPNASQGYQENIGVYNAQSSALPTNAAVTAIVQSNVTAFPVPYIAFKNMTW